MEILEQGTWVSWNENIKHPFEKLYKVTEETEIQDIIKNNDNIRIFGNKQSSADICSGTKAIIDIKDYNKVIDYNNDLKQITVQSGIKLADLIETIEAYGWCIPCLPDINTITIGGALATGTHGTSGQILADYAVNFRIIQADGSIIEVSKDDALIDAYRLSLGVLGVISTITFQCVDKYTLHVKEAPAKDSDWLKDIKNKVKQHDFLRILWLPHTGYGYQIIGTKIPEDQPINEKAGPSYLKHRRNTSVALYKNTHKRPWFTFFANKILKRLFFSSKQEHKGSLYQATVTKSRGSTLELAEWTVDLEKFPELFNELKTTINSFKNDSFIHIPMDVRFVFKEKTWLSYAYGKDVVTMGCVCRNTAEADSYEAFKTVEKLFLKYGGRPHWAKRFEASDTEFSKIYPKWNDFKALRRQVDPTNKFLNPYLKKIFNE